MLQPNSTRVFALCLLSLFTSCVFSLGGSGKKYSSNFSKHQLASKEQASQLEYDYVSGDGPPLMAAPWESGTLDVATVTGIGYTTLDDEEGESTARNQAVKDARARAEIMVGNTDFSMFETRIYLARSDTHLGVKIQYLVQ